MIRATLAPSGMAVQFSPALDLQGWVIRGRQGGCSGRPLRGGDSRCRRPCVPGRCERWPPSCFSSRCWFRASAPALAADGEPLVLRAGTDQDLQVLNPWNSVVVVDFEVFTLNYDTLVGLRPEHRTGGGLRRVVGAVRGRADVDLPHPPGHALVGRRAGDGRGCALDLPARPRRTGNRERLPRRGIPRRLPHQRRGDVGRGARCRDARRHDRIREHAAAPGLRADPSEAHLEPVHDRADRRRRPPRASSRTTRRSSGPARTWPSSGSPASSSASPATRTTGASRVPPTR